MHFVKVSFQILRGSFFPKLQEKLHVSTLIATTKFPASLRYGMIIS